MLYVHLKLPQNQWTLNKRLIQAGLVLHNLCVHEFSLTQTENLHHLSNLRDNFRFKVILHGQSMAALIFCRKLAESKVTVMPTVMYMDC
jgi:hypothetical protein